MLFFWNAHVMLAQRIQRERAGTVKAEQALGWLEFMSQDYILPLLGCMAQAAQEGLHLVRVRSSEHSVKLRMCLFCN